MKTTVKWVVRQMYRDLLEIDSMRLEDDPRKLLENFVTKYVVAAGGAEKYLPFGIYLNIMKSVGLAVKANAATGNETKIPSVLTQVTDPLAEEPSIPTPVITTVKRKMHTGNMKNENRVKLIRKFINNM